MLVWASPVSKKERRSASEEYSRSLAKRASLEEDVKVCNIPTYYLDLAERKKKSGRTILEMKDDDNAQVQAMNQDPDTQRLG